MSYVLKRQCRISKISDESKCVRRRAGETRSKEIAPDVMLPVLCLPRPVGENLGRKFPGPSLRSELAQPMCRAAYSPTLEKRELGMTKVTGITASYARCKLSKNFEGLRRPLTSKDKMARTSCHPRA